MDWKTVIFQAAGGLGLFLMGMKIMSEGMQRSAGDGLRKILRILTYNRFVSVLVGFVITAIIQSSSATSVMVVGFVNATLMTVKQAIGVELGAAVGTTVTGWIVTLDIASYSMPVIGLGVLIRLFSKNKTRQYFGEVLFGFGILFLGMDAMKHGFATLRDNQYFIETFKMIDGDTIGSVFLGILAGTVVTAVLQSSSALVGIILALASQNLINFEGALAVVMGGNIGTTVTGILASIGGSTNAKRAALAQTLFKFFGVILVILVFYPFRDAVDYVTPGVPSKSIMVHIAMGHTIFNLLNLVIFLPLITPLTRLVSKIFPDKARLDTDLPEQFVNIDYKLIETPSLGILESEKEISVMGNYVLSNMELLKQMKSQDSKDVSTVCDKIMRNEEKIDKYQKYITQFLVAVSSRSLTDKDAHTVGNYMGLAHNLEKLSDYTEKIAKIMDKISRNKLQLNPSGIKTLNILMDENMSYFKNSMDNFKNEIIDASYIEKSYIRSRRLKKLVKDAKIKHFERLRDKLVSHKVSIHFVDMLNNFEGMASENFNIAEAVSGKKY